jgi:hypothetical protein
MGASMTGNKLTLKPEPRLINYIIINIKIIKFKER